MTRHKLVHFFKSADAAPCGARGALRFSIDRSQITCPKCRAGAERHFRPAPDAWSAFCAAAGTRCEHVDPSTGQP
jgi:hypothetical protein